MKPNLKEKLQQYANLTLEWNQKMNLIAKSTENLIWQRHIEDSLQVLPLIPKGAETLVDFGSGAGFPGIVISIMAEETGLKNIHMIESIRKKTTFLNEVRNQLGLKCNIHNERIEQIKGIKADVITARAFAELSEILKISKNFLKPSTIFLLHKGQKFQEEIDNAKKKFSFDVEVIKSQTGDGVILKLQLKN
jgi:16S rRNA (guanine527-N7)-methyltransferase